MLQWFNSLIPPVHAVSEFTTSFSSLYDVDSQGTAKVIHTITLKNNLAHIYATNYTIVISGDDLRNIVASDESGSLDSDVETQNGITTINLNLSTPSIGKDKEKIISLSYQTNNMVEKIGATTTINIPRLAKANEAEHYTRTVRVRGIDDPTFISPSPNNTSREADFTTYTFEGHQNDSLTLLFGDSVTYKLNLKYELKNKELRSADTEIAIPPDTNYQHIILDKISPEPKDVRVDEDGNWLARYNLESGSKIMVEVDLYATVHPLPILSDPSQTKLQKTPHSKYWNTTSNTITDLSTQLKTPSNIYEYLVTKFSYNFTNLGIGANRLGAVTALTSPSNVLCTEFTDSFVSLARSQGIPSREVNGYGYTKNTSLQPQGTLADVLHAWPEYYDSDRKLWISVDPTWGNTTGGIDYFNKLDFSHIVFVRHGQEDSYPLPAGAYKSDPGSKYVEVSVADLSPTPSNTYEITESGNTTKIRNNGNSAIPSQTLEINGKEVWVPYIPPYGSYTIHETRVASIYDKIKSLCVKLLSVFSRLLPAST